ncbi:MAG: hypothetical protein IKV31_06270 [Paludibacteraceae bacterium]|nr:hypothetical protein [Paludibacteraceae bacterium]
MKTIFKTLALGLLLIATASCEQHDPFDENTITGAIGPHAYWTIESSMVKAGETMGFVGQYYSTVDRDYIDHSEVWYELFEVEDKVVTASLIKAFTYSVTSNITAQKRMLQTIQSYPHSEDMYSDSLRAYVLEDRFPVSNTLSPITWAQPTDTVGFNKNLYAYFGENFAAEFKAGVTAKMNPSEEERNYAAYMNVIQGLSLLTDTIVTANGDRMPYVQWITDSTFNANTNTWVKGFKLNDTVWSKVNFDTIGFKVDSTPIKEGRPPVIVGYKYDTTPILKPVVEEVIYVYPQIKNAIDSVWENHVSFYDLIQGADGYSIGYKREYYINAELRVYDRKGFVEGKDTPGAYTGGTYSKTDEKKISIN